VRLRGQLSSLSRGRSPGSCWWGLWRGLAARWAGIGRSVLIRVWVGVPGPVVGRLALLAAVPLVLVPVTPTVMLAVVLGVRTVMPVMLAGDGACSLEVGACCCFLSCGAWAVALSESGSGEVAQCGGALLRCASVVVVSCLSQVAQGRCSLPCGAGSVSSYCACVREVAQGRGVLCCAAVPVSAVGVLEVRRTGGTLACGTWMVDGARLAEVR